MRLLKAECIQVAKAVLGESPLWDASQGTLYWVDTKRPAVYRLGPRNGETAEWLMPAEVGCIGFAGKGRLVFAGAEGIGLLDLDTGHITSISDPEVQKAENQFNDGKVDRAGRFWIGSMNLAGTDATGHLYRMDGSLAVERMASGFVCSNGMGWSPDNRTLYFTDSLTRTIWAYDFDPELGALGSRRTFVQLSEDEGVPDGLTVDREGFVWSAIWDGWRVLRFAPDGSVDSMIELPVQRPTSCALGGLDLKTLYITTASDELSPADLEKGPLAGSLFAASVPVEGLPEPAFWGCF